MSDMESLQVKRLDAALGVASSVMMAIAAAPGSGADKSEIDRVASVLLQRASELAKVAMPLVGNLASNEQAASLRNRVRQYAADTVSLQWRIEQSIELPGVDAKRLSRLFEQLANDSVETETSADDSVPTVMPVAVAKRLALLAAANDIREAVAAFNYFQDDTNDIVENSFGIVVAAAGKATEALVDQAGLIDQSREAVRSQMQIKVIDIVAKIYGETYRAEARRAVKALADMQPVEKLRRMHEYKAGAWPLKEIEAAFDLAIGRTLEMVASVPSVKTKSLEQTMKTEPREAL